MKDLYFTGCGCLKRFQVGGVDWAAVGERFRLICFMPGGQNSTDGIGRLWRARGESSRSPVVRLQEELLFIRIPAVRREQGLPKFAS